mmetsp:Transcript_25086/g.58373  ORF Transcript_25086/g.58373 Transcript_25086/m.58373 type:complete len:205 (-) Transcript_25086:568-1182(-)
MPEVQRTRQTSSATQSWNASQAARASAKLTKAFGPRCRLPASAGTGILQPRHSSNSAFMAAMAAFVTGKAEVVTFKAAFIDALTTPMTLSPTSGARATISDSICGTTCAVSSRKEMLVCSMVSSAVMLCHRLLNLEHTWLWSANSTSASYFDRSPNMPTVMLESFPDTTVGSMELALERLKSGPTASTMVLTSFGCFCTSSMPP